MRDETVAAFLATDAQHTAYVKNAMSADSVPVDYTDEDTYLTTTCSYCRATVTYANTKIVRVAVDPRPPYPGMITHLERRICKTH